MFSLPQSTAFTVVFKAFLSSDHVTEATSKTIAITISKAGAAFGNPAAGALNATEISSGWYKVALGTGDTDTLGILAIRGTAGTIDDYGDRFFVVSATTGGLTNLDAAVSAVKSKTDNLPSDPADESLIIAATDALATAIAAVPTANANADALLDRSNAVETGITPRGLFRLIGAVLAGKVSGAATTTNTFRNIGDSKDRVTATVDSSGNRTAITTDVT